MQSLIFFNKEGDNLNFTYNQEQERWEGDLIFHENSDETYKTIGLYTFERVKGFEYENPGNLKLRKFQLFNEYKFNFLGNENYSSPITLFETSNKDPNFFSKWIYGEHFESKFPKGTRIRFNQPLFEFTNPNQLYTVVSTKKNAIMILSNVDNSTFYQNYGIEMGLSFSYVDKTISGTNLIGVYNYLTDDFRERFSQWSEPEFYDRFFNKRKLNIIGTEKNDGIVTVKNKDLLDTVYHTYQFSKYFLTQSCVFSMMVTLKTEAPIVFSGNLNAEDNKLYFNKVVPPILKPGSVFSIPTSVLNPNFVTVNQIPSFVGNANVTFYDKESLVIWNNLIYECITPYTWSATSSLNPDNTSYWKRATQLPIVESLNKEVLLDVEIHLNTNKLLYTQSFTQSGAVTLGSLSEKYKEELKIFDLDLYYKKNNLHVDLLYPSDYCSVEFSTSLSPNVFANKKNIYEFNFELEEVLKTENNYSTNENFKWNIVFTDLDDFGFKVFINKQVYQQEIVWVYEVGIINYQRSIDKTLRRWFTTWYLQLFTLGIYCKVGFTGVENDIYYNSIQLSTVYPNVPLDFEIEVGTTADYYIEHSEIIFKDIGNYLNVTINDRAYPITVATFSQQNYDISTTLVNWLDIYQDTLLDFNILTDSVNDTLIFRTKFQYQRLDYTFQVGKSGLPNEELYIIYKKYKGSLGALITSNEVVLPGYDKIGNQKEYVDSGPNLVDITEDILNTKQVIATYSFEKESFSTGQIVSINNTIYPYNNQEYNIITLEPQNLILDYRGPFWSTLDLTCNVSPFVKIAFSEGLGSTACDVLTQSVDLGGEFDRGNFSNQFILSYGTTNSYSIEQYGIPGDDKVIDIIYTSITENLYLLGDKLTVIDANLSTVTQVIDLPGVTGSIQIGINSINQLIYCLSAYGIHIVEPRTLFLESSFTHNIVNKPKKIEFNRKNGDLFLIYENSSDLYVWKSTNLTSIPDFTITLASPIVDIVFNTNESDLYLSLTNDSMVRLDGSTREIQTTYNIVGLTSSLFYEPSESAIYSFASSGLNKINNGNISVFANIQAQDKNYFVYNNTQDVIVISQTNLLSTIYKENGSLVSSISTSDVGPLVVNQYDGDVYIAADKELKVFSSREGKFLWSQRFTGPIQKIVYNPLRNSVYGVIPQALLVFEEGGLLEAKVTLGLSFQSASTQSVNLEDNLYGSFDVEYRPKTDTWLNAREYIRKPRENYEGDLPVELIWKWENDLTPEMFIFDISGDQLKSNLGSYSYIGTKPLPTIVLNNTPNKDIGRISDPTAQQTIFQEIVKGIDYIDSSTNFRNNVESIELFLGYNSQNEGVNSSILKLYKRESLEFTITSTPNNLDIIQFSTLPDGSGSISMNKNSDTNFYFTNDGKKRGLKVGQIIQIFISDVTNTRNRYISTNSGISIKITHVFNKTIIGTFMDSRAFTTEFTQIDNYPKDNKTTYLSARFTLKDKEIGTFNVYGQTEIEDIRYKIELGNAGQLLNPQDIYIFKSYDINEQGIDWGFLNKKRKELLMVRDQIYSYIGSYKAIINSINYFGYNDLELYEYYRNINEESKDFNKLFKIEIPDIFDNTIEGWTENDFIKHTLPNPNFDSTNLFNLTFNITNKFGDNLLYYSLNEVLIKLQGLKLWLQSNTIPLTHRILDITGRADFVGTNIIQHRNYDARIINIRQQFTPYDFKLNEAYLMPINSGSTVYTCVVDFYLAEEEYASEYFNIKIRTYQTYKEWQPFKTYSIGDRVIYFGQIYESAIDNNRLFNPRKWDNIPNWTSDGNFVLGDYTNYLRDIYQYVGTQSSTQVSGSNQITPVRDITDNQSLSRWILMTQWKKIDYSPVQTLSEFRLGTQSYIFTVDSNLDPFVEIEVTSDNGYGQNYTVKRNYEIRGTKDLIDAPSRGDQMSPFLPIDLVENTTVTAPIITSELIIIPTMNESEIVEFVVDSDKSVTNWEIINLTRINCSVTVTYELLTTRSMKISVKTSASTKTGSYNFRVKGFVVGGYSATSDLISGTVVRILPP